MKRPTWTARPYVGAPDDRTTEMWAIAIVLILALFIVGAL